MITYHPPEIFVAFGGLAVHTYGLILASAILIAFLWAESRVKNYEIDPGIAGEIYFWAVAGGLLGARLGFVVQEISYYSRHLVEILAIRDGGLSFHGAIIGGVLGGWLAMRYFRQTQYFWQLADAAAFPVLLGAVLGRLGNWANQELYGYPTNLPWGIAIDQGHRLPGYEQFSAFHPTFTYEALLNLVGLGILLLIECKSQKSKVKNTVQKSKILSDPGALFLLMLAWYSLARGITEIWRISDRLVGPLSLAQIVSLGTILIAGWLFIRQKKISG